MSFDRLMSVKLKLWKTIYFTPKRAFASAIALIVIFVLLNINVIVLFGKELLNENGTVVFVFCFKTNDPDTYWMSTWNTVSISNLKFYS